MPPQIEQYIATIRTLPILILVVILCPVLKKHEECRKPETNTKSNLKET